MKKTEKKYFALYLSVAALGLILLFFDMSKILPFPDAFRDFMNTKWQGLNLYSIIKIFGIHIVCL